MKLLLFSDLHCDLEQAARLVELSQDVDAVVAAGDICTMHRGLDATIAVLRRIERPTVLVPGNAETTDELVAACEVWPSSTVLHGTGACVDDGQTPCDDSNICTEDDRCQIGLCRGDPCFRLSCGPSSIGECTPTGCACVPF